MSAEQVIADALCAHAGFDPDVPMVMRAGREVVDLIRRESEAVATALRDAGLLVAPGSVSVPIEALRAIWQPDSAGALKVAHKTLAAIFARLDSASQDQPSQEAH